MDHSTGVYFQRKDYASLWQRFVVDIIDSLAVFVICLLVTLILSGLIPGTLLFWCWVAVLFTYLVILKRSSFGTLGYRACRVKIVGQNGEAPGFGCLTLRALFLVLGPLNYLLDVMWLAGDPHRQALRDKIGETYVVKKGSQPAGRGRLVHRYYDILGYHCLFREIEVEKGQAETASG